MNLRYESLHNHTVISDGVQTHLEALSDAKDLGIGVMAFTDHDTLPNQRILDALRTYDGPVKWLIGVELSSWIPKESGGPDKGAVHVLGLFVDVHNKALIDFCRGAEKSRQDRMKMYVTHLQSIGFDVTEDDVRAIAGSPNIGKPHMVKAVLAKSHNRVKMDQLKDEMQEVSKHDEKVRKAYKRMIEGGPNQYPYALFMGGDSFKPAPKSDFGSLVDYASTVKLIRDAGGLAIAAHWHLEPEKMGRADLEQVLASGGLDGLESEAVNLISKRDVSKAAAETRALAKQYGVFVAATSDSHKRQDLEAFVRDPVAETTAGLTRRLIERYSPNLTWSNLA